MGRTRTVIFVSGLGVLSWLIPLVAATAIGPLRESNRPLFESIMPVVVVMGAVVLGGHVVLKRTMSPRAAAGVGLAWAAINIALDLPLFTWGPMRTPLTAYLADIGLVYLIHPIVLAGLARMNRSASGRACVA